MKRVLLVLLSMCFVTNIVMAKTDLTCPEQLLPKESINVLKKGEAFTYPLPEGAIIECYAKEIDGSIDDLKEFNDYYVVRNGSLYSNTMHRFFKKTRSEKLKKVDYVGLESDKTTLFMYDPLWTPTYRHHTHTVKINTKTGEYYSEVFQDNWTWFRKSKGSGYCRIIYPQK